MRLPPVITILAALIALAIVGAVSLKVIYPTRPLLTQAAFTLSKITPNADGVEDVTQINYSLSRNAKVTISFTNKTTNQQFIFRNAEARPGGDYQVLFSGIVDGYTLPGETINGNIETRLMPNGDYKWLIHADSESGDTAEATGDLVVADADTALPAIQDFSISPKTFTPNQDGIDDRVNINVYLAKAATLTVYLQGQDGKQYFISERDEGRKPGDPGAHFFDYDGGVDNNITPPPDGDYTVYAIAEDKVGQRMSRKNTVTLFEGGLPNAEIKPQSTGCTVCFSTITYKDSYYTDASTPGERIPLPSNITVQSTQAVISMPQNDLLFFRLTISNYGSTPLRTIGPWPGTVYQYDQTWPAMRSADTTDPISGAWRVGVQCEQSETSYPWRWAIGAQDQLKQVKADNGDVYYYLMPPGDKDYPSEAVVWGAVRMTKIYKTRNPQDCYAALIHEDVAIPPLQNQVGTIKVELTQ